ELTRGTVKVMAPFQGHEVPMLHHVARVIGVGRAVLASLGGKHRTAISEACEAHLAPVIKEITPGSGGREQQHDQGRAQPPSTLLVPPHSCSPPCLGKTLTYARPVTLP